MELLLAVVLVIGELQGAGQTNQNAGVVTGRVANSVGAEGFPDIPVLLVGPLTGAAANAATGNPLMIEEIAEGSGTPQARTTTGADGRFSFRNLPPGQYMLRAQKEGYFGAIPSPVGSLTTIVTAPVTVAADATASEVRLALVRSVIFSGRVRDASRQPVPNAPVGAYQLSYRDGRATLSLVSSRGSDDRGEYRFYGQAPGEYYLAVGSMDTRDATPASLRGPDLCCKTFYPSASDFRSAVPLSLTEGAEVSGKDIDILTPLNFKVSGRVLNLTTGPNGQPRTPSIILVPTSDQVDAGSTYYSSISVTADGAFELQGVPSGSYDLVATVPDGTGRTYPGRVRLDVASRDVEGVAVSIAPGREVRIRVVVDGTLTAGSGMRMQLRQRDNSLGVLFSGAATPNPPDASGTFVFASVPQSTYSVVPSGVPTNSYVADVREGGVSVYDTGLVVGDRPLGPIDVLVNSGAQSTRGTVRDANGKPVVSSTVVLVPSPAHRKNPLLYRTFRTDANGGFALNNIPPGEYKLFAWQSLPNTAYLNAAFMAKYESRGLAINLAGGENASFDLTVIPF